MKTSFLITKAAVCALALTAACSCNKPAGSPAPASASGSSSACSEIAYVYVDSLVNGYDLFNDETTKLMAKSQQYEQELNSKAKSIERRAMELQQNFEKKLVTPTRAQEIQQQLGIEQQKLMQLRDQHSMELADDQAQIMNRVGDSIKNYIKEYNSDGHLKMVISTQGSSTLLYADPSLDITNDILKALNNRYNKNGGASALAPAADTAAAK